MSINPRRKRHSKKKLLAYILLLIIFGASVYSLNIFFVFKKPLFISPIGKVNADPVLVGKILKDKGILFSDITLSDSSYIINLQNNGQVRLSQNKDVGGQITSLQRILRELTIEGKPFKSIDFRFSEPIIVF